MATTFILSDNIQALSVDKRICFISSRSSFSTGENTVVMDWANGRLIHELSNVYGKNFSLAIFSDPIRGSNYNFEIKADRIYRLPFPFSYASGIRNIFKIRRLMRSIEKENDLLIIQLPFIGFPALLGISRPIIFHVCANVLTAAVNPFKYRGLARLLSLSYANLMHGVNKMLFRRVQSRVIVNGMELARLYQIFDPTITVSSSIYSSEMISELEIATRAESEDFVILFIGRPSKEKGFHTLIDSFVSLVDTGKPVKLKLMGVKREELEKILGKSLVESYFEKITFFGFISWGEEFRSIVQSSHCLVVSSISEGTPRVLVEARALGCPVIATNIGGIGTSVTNGSDGILINPENPSEISSAITSLFDEKLRIRLAKNGLVTVKKYSLENFVTIFTNNVQKLKLL